MINSLDMHLLPGANTPTTFFLWFARTSLIDPEQITAMHGQERSPE